MRNNNLKFICKDVHLKVENADTAFTKSYAAKSTVRFPIAHQEGNFFATKDDIKSMEDSQQIAFRYASEDGAVNDNANPNGSIDNIAGVFNKEKNILGLMPHPERLWEEALGGTDGKAMFSSLIKHLSG